MLNGWQVEDLLVLHSSETNKQHMLPGGARLWAPDIHMITGKVGGAVDRVTWVVIPCEMLVKKHVGSVFCPPRHTTGSEWEGNNTSSGDVQHRQYTIAQHAFYEGLKHRIPKPLDPKYQGHRCELSQFLIRGCSKVTAHAIKTYNAVCGFQRES